MKRMLILIVAIAFLVLAACVTKSPADKETLGKNAAPRESSNSDEVKINAADLPGAILAYLEQNFQGYILEEAEREGSCEAVTFTIEIQLNGEEMELVFDSSGRFVGLEEDEENDDDEEENEEDEEENEREIDVSELSQVVVDAIATLYPESTLMEVDEITAADGSLSYDVEIQIGSEIIEVMFAADGTFLGMEDDDDKEGDIEDEDNDDDDGDDEEDDNDNAGDHENEEGE